MTDDELHGLLARLPAPVPPAVATARIRSLSQIVLARRKHAAVERPVSRLASRVAEATAFVAMFLYLAGAVGEAVRLLGISGLGRQ